MRMLRWAAAALVFAGAAAGAARAEETIASIMTLAGHSDIVRRGAFSPDGSRIVTASWDRTARIWDAKTGGTLAILSGHSAHVWNAVFSPDGSRIVTISRDLTARIWDARTGAALATLSGHSDDLNSAAFNPDGSRIVTASNDKTAMIWDARSGAALATLSGHSSVVNSAVFSPDGSRIITVSSDDTVRIWDVTNLAQQAAERNRLVERRAAALAALSCDEAKALDARLGGDDATGCVFDKLLKTGAAREMYLAAVKFEADKERGKAKRLYLTIVDRFPQDDLALKAGDRITALADVEAVESSNAATERAAAAARATAEAEGRANREALAQAGRNAEADRCRGRGACNASCTSVAGDYNSYSYCKDQCASRFAGC